VWFLSFSIVLPYLLLFSRLSPNFYEFLIYMICEMLSEFSTSPDKSMNVADLGNMVRAVNLV
jgi:hypothetical protein